MAFLGSNDSMDNKLDGEPLSRTGRHLVTRLLKVLLAAGLFAQVSIASASEPEFAKQWPQWRGPLGTGVAPHADPPVSWSEDKNIRWKVAVDGLGHSTPVVWDQHIVLTAAVPFGEKLPPVPEKAPGAHDNKTITQRHRFAVIAFDRATGKQKWKTTVAEQLPHEGGHNTGSLASASPVTDGKFIYAHFGSRGLYCLDFQGKVQWKKDLGRMQTLHGHGEGSSPALFDDTIVVNWDHEGQSFVVAMDKTTGKEKWRKQRDEVTSWATPIVVSFEGKNQLIVSGTKRVRSYDLATGAVLWECGGLSRNVVASPVAADGMVFAASSYDTKAMLAIRLKGASGDLTDSKNIIWKKIRKTPYVPSPLLYGDSIYFLRHYQGILSRVTASTGEEPVGPFRLGPIRNIYASPVGAAGRVYVTDQDGMTIVISHTDKDPQALGLNRLNDRFNASAVAVGKELFLRGERYLYCIAEPSK